MLDNFFANSLRILFQIHLRHDLEAGETGVRVEARDFDRRLAHIHGIRFTTGQSSGDELLNRGSFA